MNQNIIIIFLLFIFLLPIGGKAVCAGELHFAAAKGDIKQVKKLVNIGNDLNELSSDPLKSNKEFPRGTPLYWATAYGHDVIVTYLIKKGANVNAVTDFGENPMESVPLEEAISRKNFNIAKILLNNGANVEGSNHVFFWPLQIAAEKADMAMLKLLISNNASINREGVDGYTALHFAAENGHLDVGKLLLKNGADVNYCWDACCITPLHLAVEYGHIEMVRLLVNNGSKIDLINCMGESPLSLASGEILRIMKKR